MGYKGIVPQKYLDHLTEKRWENFLKTTTLENLVVVKEGCYIGTATIASSKEKGLEGMGEVVGLYVLPEYWGKGIGKKLLDEGIKILKEQGLSLFTCGLWKKTQEHENFMKKTVLFRLEKKKSLSLEEKNCIK